MHTNEELLEEVLLDLAMLRLLPAEVKVVTSTGERVHDASMYCSAPETAGVARSLGLLGLEAVLAGVHGGACSGCSWKGVMVAPSAVPHAQARSLKAMVDCHELARAVLSADPSLETCKELRLKERVVLGFAPLEGVIQEALTRVEELVQGPLRGAYDEELELLLASAPAGARERESSSKTYLLELKHLLPSTLGVHASALNGTRLNERGLVQVDPALRALVDHLEHREWKGLVRTSIELEEPLTSRLAEAVGALHTPGADLERLLEVARAL
jgi:hypothetical protein